MVPPMKKLSPFNAQFITETYFPEYQDNPELINQGQCFQWAYLAHQTFAGTELWDLHYHAFIKYKGRFYDSETPNGVKDWRELPIVREYGVPEKRKDWAHKSKELKFKINWGYSRRKFQLNWKKLHNVAATVVKAVQKNQV